MSASRPRPSTVTAPSASSADSHTERLERARACGATSSPPARPRSRDRPSAIAANSSARCEIALVAGHPQPAAQRPRPGQDQLVGSHVAHASDGVRGDVVAVLEQRGLERVEAALGDDQHEHTGAALERVRDLEVGDVDAEAAGQRGDLGDHALAVGHRDPQLDQRLLDREADGQVAARGTRVGSSSVEQRVAVAAGDDAAHRVRARRGSASSASTIASRLARQMSGQIAGWLDAMRVMSRKPPAARRSSTACSSLPRLATFISVDAASCGTWLTTATSASWSSGVTASASAPSVADPRAHRGERARGRCAAVGVSTQVAPTNRSALGAGETLLLRAGHRVAADEARRQRRAAPPRPRRRPAPSPSRRR